jgi:hypothetical protein
MKLLCTNVAQSMLHYSIKFHIIFINITQYAIDHFTVVFIQTVSID